MLAIWKRPRINFRQHYPREVEGRGGRRKEEGEKRGKKRGDRREENREKRERGRVHRGLSTEYSKEYIVEETK